MPDMQLGEADEVQVMKFSLCLTKSPFGLLHLGKIAERDQPQWLQIIAAAHAQCLSMQCMQPSKGFRGLMWVWEWHMHA